MAFKIEKGASKPTAMRNVSGGQLGACLANILKRTFNETNDKKRSGVADFGFEHSGRAISKCGVGVNVKLVPVRRTRIKKPTKKKSTLKIKTR